jgi:hypothetical protein
MAKSGKKGNRTEAGLVNSEVSLSVAHFDKRLAELASSLASKEDIAALKECINRQKDCIQNLESKVAVLESKVSFLLGKTEEAEQYSRRLCLRIDGIPLPQHNQPETPEDIRKAVQTVISEAGVKIPDDIIDRAHRIGQGRIVAGQRCRQVIVRFSTFRHRTLLFKARKKIPKYRIYLDLTKERKSLVDEVNGYIEQNGLKNGYAFADINCRICVKFDNQFSYITTFDDFLHVVGRSN